MVKLTPQSLNDDLDKVTKHTVTISSIYFPICWFCRWKSRPRAKEIVHHKLADRKLVMGSGEKRLIFGGRRANIGMFFFSSEGYFRLGREENGCLSEVYSIML